MDSTEVADNPQIDGPLDSGTGVDVVAENGVDNMALDWFTNSSDATNAYVLTYIWYTHSFSRLYFFPDFCIIFVLFFSPPSLYFWLRIL